MSEQEIAPIRTDEASDVRDKYGPYSMVSRQVYSSIAMSYHLLFLISAFDNLQLKAAVTICAITVLSSDFTNHCNVFKYSLFALPCTLSAVF